MLLSIAIAVFFLLCLLGGMLGRMDGGGGFKTAEWTERILIMIFFVVACIPFAEWASPIAIAGAVGLATGHGQYFLSRTIKAITPERLDFIVRIFFGEDPRCHIKYYDSNNIPAAMALLKQDVEAYGLKKLYWRCAFGMFVTGTLVGLPACLLALYYGAWLEAAIFALTGVIKAGAYIIAHKATGGTEAAEWGNGAGRTALALGALIVGVMGALAKRKDRGI